MDPSLLRERELFRKHALSTPAVEKRPAPSAEPSSSKKKKVKVEQGGPSSSKQSSDHSNGSFNLKALSGSSGYKHDQQGLGGIFLEEIEEGLPNAHKAIKALGDQILFVTRPDKRQLLYYNDKSCHFSVDEEFRKLWRSIPMDSIDEDKVEEYLKRQGISSMREAGPRKIAPAQRKKPTSQKKRRFKTHNDHLAGVLKDYSDVTPGQQ